MSRWLRPLPQWCAIALHPPQELVQVRLRTAHSEFDLTRNNVIAALRPLTVAIGLDAPLELALQEKATCELLFIDARSGGTLGVLGLERQQDWATDAIQLALFGVSSGRHRCLSWPAVRYGQRPNPATSR
jgi:hypothetical protein